MFSLGADCASGLSLASLGVELEVVKRLAISPVMGLKICAACANSFVHPVVGAVTGRSVRETNVGTTQASAELEEGAVADPFLGLFGVRHPACGAAAEGGECGLAVKMGDEGVEGFGGWGMGRDG